MTTIDDILINVKHNLALSSTARDDYLRMIIESAIAEAANSGIDPGGQSESYKREYYQYIADHAVWLYRTRGGDGEYPRFLRLRRNNLMVGRE